MQYAMVILSLKGNNSCLKNIFLLYGISEDFKVPGNDRMFNFLYVSVKKSTYGIILFLICSANLCNLMTYKHFMEIDHFLQNLGTEKLNK